METFGTCAVDFWVSITETEIMSTHPLTEYRRAHDGMTLEALAAKIGASKSMVWKWENWKAEPRQIYRQKIMDLTGASLNELLAGKQEEAA